MRYFVPQTGECYDFGAGQTPPRGWKKVKPIPSPLPPGLGPGSTVTWQPGKEPKLIVNTKTGECQWLHFPFIVPNSWMHLRMRHTPPGNTTEAGTYYNPQTGDAFNFEPGQSAPGGWKKMGPIPSPIPPGLGPGGTVTWVPGREPRLYIRRETGECRWMYFGEIPLDGWVPFNPLPSMPESEAEKTYFNPQTGDSYKVSGGWTPPQGWKILGPIPSPLTPGLPPGSTVTYAPGKEPRLYVNTKTGECKWMPFGEFPIEPWKPLSQKPFPAGTSEEQADRDIKNLLLEEWVHLYGSEASTDYPLEPEKVEEASRDGRSRSEDSKDEEDDDEWWITSFVKALPGALAETFTSGEAYSSFAQASETAVGFISLGALGGNPDQRAKELEAMGFKRPDRQTEAIVRGIGKYGIGLPLSLALGSAAWQALRLPTMSVAVLVPTRSTGFMTHVVYGVSEGGAAATTWMHAMGAWFRMGVSMFPKFKMLPGWIALTEIPILNPAMVLAMVTKDPSVGNTWFCFTAAITGFFRGWRPF